MIVIYKDLPSLYVSNFIVINFYLIFINFKILPYMYIAVKYKEIPYLYVSNFIIVILLKN